MISILKPLLARVCGVCGFAWMAIALYRKKQYNCEDNFARVTDAREAGRHEGAARGYRGSGSRSFVVAQAYKCERCSAKIF